MKGGAEVKVVRRPRHATGEDGPLLWRDGALGVLEPPFEDSIAALGIRVAREGGPRL